MKKTQWNIEVIDTINPKNTPEKSSFEGSFPQCEKYIKNRFLNKKIPNLNGGLMTYYSPKRYTIEVTTII